MIYDTFFENQDIIISVIDNNISARKYRDSLCTFYNKIIIDSGNEGKKSNIDIYYSDKTICLNDINFNIKETIFMCTLKIIPTLIKLCVKYAEIIFTELFD